MVAKYRRTSFCAIGAIFSMLLVLLLAVNAQAAPLMDDPAGNQDVTYAGAPSPNESHPEMDLIEGDFVEVDGGFEAWLKSSSPEPEGSSGGFFGGNHATMYFEYEAVRYGVIYLHWNDLDGTKTLNAYLLQLSSPGALLRYANAGETALLNFTVAGGAASGQFDASLAGLNADWARIVGPASVRLGPGDEATIRVAVALPPGIAEGTRADLSLSLRPSIQGGTGSVLRFVVEVDESKNYVDGATLAASLESPTKASPGVAFVPGMMLVFVLGLGRRR
jgi:hypothetical protein